MGKFLAHEKIPFRLTNYCNAVILNIHLTQCGLVTLFWWLAYLKESYRQRTWSFQYFQRTFERTLLSVKPWKKVLESLMPPVRERSLIYVKNFTRKKNMCQIGQYFVDNENNNRNHPVKMSKHLKYVCCARIPQGT